MLKNVLICVDQYLHLFYSIYQNEGKYPATYTSFRENESIEQETLPLGRNHEYYALLNVEDCERADETRVEIISALKEHFAATWIPGTNF